MSVLPLPLPRTEPASPPAGSRIPWARHSAYLDRNWNPGQHVGIISPTGRGGKSWLITRGLLPLWQDFRVLYIDVKDHDDTLEGWKANRVDRFPSRLQVKWAKRKWFRLHVPSALAGGGSENEQYRVIHDALSSAYRQRDWLIVVDEMAFLTESPDLKKALRDIWKRGRTHVTLVTATQAPRWVPGEAYDQPTFLYLGRLNAEGNKRLGEIGGTVDYKVVREALGGVHMHEFLFLDKTVEDMEQEMAIVKVGR